MLYYRAECPHCGNEITVNNVKEVQKCCWCKRLMSVNLQRKKKKIRCEIEPIDFSEDQKRDYSKTGR